MSGIFAYFLASNSKTEGTTQRERIDGFSLVEIVLAIGIFSFVAVAILGLFSVALKMRADSAFETRAAIISTEIFSSIKMSGGPLRAIFRDGPALLARNNTQVNFSREKVVVGYTGNTTVPFGMWHSSRGQDPQSVWDSGNLEPWALNNQIQTLALVSALPVANKTNLYQVTCSVKTPASLPIGRASVTTFSTFMTTQ